MAVLKDPHLHVVLYQPEIPANTGNIARLCGAAQLRLHLIHPLGFSVDDKHLKRAGLDYWPEIDVQHHVDFDAFLNQMPKDARLFCFSRHADLLYPQAKVDRGDYLLFGRETLGLPERPAGRLPLLPGPHLGESQEFEPLNHRGHCNLSLPQRNGSFLIPLKFQLFFGQRGDLKTLSDSRQ